jgi:hypothetical protein
MIIFKYYYTRQISMNTTKRTSIKSFDAILQYDLNKRDLKMQDTNSDSSDIKNK